MLRRGALALVILLGLSGVAAAGEPPPSEAEVQAAREVEIVSLEAQIQKGAGQVEALASEGCAVACQALGSMRRSADRLCGLEQGSRCASARGKVREAEERVRVACPSCSVAEGPMPVARAELGDKTAPAPSAPMDVAVRRSGGCAGCEIGGEAHEGAGLLALAAGLGLAAARRSRRRADRGARPR